MYCPKHFSSNNELEIRRLIRAYPLAALVILDQDRFLSANHIPLIFGSDHRASSDNGEGQEATLLEDTLQGHIPHASRLWENAHNDVELLVIFQGAQGYISPNWYPSKRTHSRVVPTWNYEAVHIRGWLRVVDDTSWILHQLTTMTRLAEKDFSPPWQLIDAPDAYIQKLAGGLLGIEIKITHVEAKAKLSQNQSEDNQLGVLAGLDSLGTPNAQVLAEAIRRRR